MVIPLKELIERDRLDTVDKSILCFTCQDADVESFLKNKAIDFEKRDKSRTYLITDDENNNLLGYFTLSLTTLAPVC